MTGVLTSPRACVVPLLAANREKFLTAAASAPKSFSEVQVRVL
jgi:hypothetical protein